MKPPLRQIIDTLNAIVTFNADESMPDADFIANIDAINLLCNLCDYLGLDRTETRRKMENLYPEFPRRVYSKEDIQTAFPLIMALHSYIYGRDIDNADRGPATWRESFIEMCGKVVSAYRTNPYLHPSAYLYCLLNAPTPDDGKDSEARKILDACAKDISKTPIEEQIRRAWAYKTACLHLRVDPDKWIDTIDTLQQIDPATLSDSTFLLWSEVTGNRPQDEFQRRSPSSPLMKIEYLQSLSSTAAGSVPGARP